MIAVDTKNCDREPIHIPGRIQPHGVLFALSESDLTIERVTENASEALGIHPNDLLGRRFPEFLSPAHRNRFLEALEKVTDTRPRLVRIHWQGRDNRAAWNASAHRFGGFILIEIEPEEERASGSLLNSTEVQDAIERLQGAKDLTELGDIVAEEVQLMTGYDRVMVYKFDERWNGLVVAEARSGPEVDSYLGLWFPASDIPKQAREIFYRNWLRMIPNAQYRPVKILPEGEPPLDLSYSALRSVSPMHLEYLKNMRVGASLTISIRREGKLWGLVACHHETPKWIGYELRAVSEFLGRLMSSLIVCKEALEDNDYREKLAKVHRTLVSYMSEEDDFVRGLVKQSPNLLDLTASSGAAAAVYFEGKWTLIGQVPQVAQINSLVKWLKENCSDLSLFYTSSLPSLWPEAAKFKEVAAGVIAVSIPKSEDNFILWFRPEAMQTVSWAGNPDKPLVQEDAAARLHPRASFEIWKQAVGNCSLPWRPAELEAARELRRSIIELDLERQFKKERLARAEADSERKRIEFLAEVSKVLASSLDYQTTLTNVAQLAVNGFCDWCSICLMRDDGFHRVVTVHATAQGQEVANRLNEFPCPASHGVNPFAEVFTTGKAYLAPRIDYAWLNEYTSDPVYRNFLKDNLGMRSYLCAPLSSHGRRMGLIEFVNSESRRYFSESDLRFAEELARRAAVAIDNSELYRETKDLYERTERANRLKEEVLAVVSHDLKNPVRSVLFNISMVKRQLDKQAKSPGLSPIVDALRNIEASTNQMKALIQDLLDVTKIEAKASLSLDYSEHSLFQLIKEIVEILSPLAREKKQALVLEEGEQDCRLKCDPRRIQQVISNLIGNALKFTPAQGKVSVRIRQTEEWARFEVEDNGPGIPKDQLLHIFERFWQGHSQSREGLGLGLSIAKGIVEAHGGNLEVVSHLGEGSTFSVALPRHRSTS